MYISISNPNISIRTAEYEGKQILLIGGDHKTARLQHMKKVMEG